MPAQQPAARTPLHHWHARHGARFIDSGGWHLPAAYLSVAREVAAARNGLAIADVSAWARISVLGRDVAALTRALAGDGAASKPRGVVALEARETVLACRLTSDHLLLLAATTDRGLLDDLLAAQENGLAVVRSDVTSALAGFCLVGQHIDEVLRHLTALDISSAVLPPGSCAETALAGVHALLVRPPEAGPPTLHIHVGWDLAEYTWERVLEAGRGFGIQPLGWEGLRSLGLQGEAGQP